MKVHGNLYGYSLYATDIRIHADTHPDTYTCS